MQIVLIKKILKIYIQCSSKENFINVNILKICKNDDTEEKTQKQYQINYFTTLSFFHGKFKQEN